MRLRRRRFGWRLPPASSTSAALNQRRSHCRPFCLCLPPASPRLPPSNWMSAVPAPCSASSRLSCPSRVAAVHAPSLCRPRRPPTGIRTVSSVSRPSPSRSRSTPPSTSSVWMGRKEKQKKEQAVPLLPSQIKKKENRSEVRTKLKRDKKA